MLQWEVLLGVLLKGTSAQEPVQMADHLALLPMPGAFGLSRDYLRIVSCCGKGSVCVKWWMIQYDTSLLTREIE